MAIKTWEKRDRLEPFSPEFLNNSAAMGDCLEIMGNIPDRSVHFVALFPPYYNAMPYAEYSSYKEYIDFMEKVGRESMRVIKEGRFMAVNTSPVIVKRESRSDRSVRLPIPFDLNTIYTSMGWEFYEDIVWVKPDGAAKMRNGDYGRSGKPLCWRPNLVTEYIMVYRHPTLHSIEWNLRGYGEKGRKNTIPDGWEKTNVWNISPASDPIHPAVAPLDLVGKLIECYTFRGDLVLDPFGGSGTTGLAAATLGRKFALIERNEKYFNRIKERLSGVDGVKYYGA